MYIPKNQKSKQGWDIICKRVKRPLIYLSIFTMGAVVGSFFLANPDPVPPCGGHMVPFLPYYNNTICTETIGKYFQNNINYLAHQLEPIVLLSHHFCYNFIYKVTINATLQSPLTTRLQS